MAQIRVVDVEDELESDFYSMVEIAQLMGVSKVTVYKMVRAGTIPAIVVGDTLKVPKEAYRMWLEKVSGDALASLVGQVE